MNDFELTTIVNAINHSSLVERLGWTLLHSVWQLGLIAVSVKLSLLVISQRFSTTRYSIAFVGLCVSVAIPMVTFGLIEPTAQLAVVRLGEVSTWESLEHSAIEIAAAHSHTSDVIESQSWNVAALNRLDSWLPLLTIAWILGACLFLVRPALGVFTVSRLKRTGTGPVAGNVERQLQTLITAMRISRPVQLMQSTMTNVPMVVGFFRPMILLPASAMTNLSAQELEAILAHELAHLRRYDDFVNLGQTIIESVFFYHPCVWWMSSLVRTERENCCDDVAVSIVGGPKPLANALLQLESSRVAEPALSANGGSLVKRIRRLSPDPKSEFKFRRHNNPWIYCATCAALLFLVGLFGFVAERHAEAITPTAVQEVEDKPVIETIVVESEPQEESNSDKSHEDLPVASNDPNSKPEVAPSIRGSVEVMQDPKTGILTLVGEPDDIALARKFVDKIKERNAQNPRARDQVIALENLNKAKESPGKSEQVDDLEIGDPVKIIADPKTGLATIVGQPDDVEAVRRGVEKIQSEVKAFQKIDSPLYPKNAPSTPSVKLAKDFIDDPLAEDLSTSQHSESTDTLMEAIELMHRDANVVAESVSIMFAESVGMGTLDIAPDKTNKVLVVKASEKSGLGYAKRLVKMFDVPPKTFEPIESEKIPRVATIRAKHRKADQLAAIIEEYYKDRKAKLKINTNTITNSIIIVADKSLLEEIKTLISTLDKPNKTENMEVKESTPDNAQAISDHGQDKPTVRVSPIYLAYVEVGEFFTIKTDFAVAQMLVDSPQTAKFEPVDPRVTRVTGLTPGQVFVEMKGLDNKSVRYKISVYRSESERPKSENYRRLQSYYFKERKEIDLLSQSGSLSKAIERAEELRQTILDEPLLDQKSKSALIKISEMDVRALNVELGIRKNAIKIEPQRVVVPVEPGQSVHIGTDFDITEILLSKDDVFDVVTLDTDKIRITAKVGASGTCDLDLIDRANKTRRRYRFEFAKTNPSWK